MQATWPDLARATSGMPMRSKMPSSVLAGPKVWSNAKAFLSSFSAPRMETVGSRTTAASVVSVPEVFGPHARRQLKLSPPSASSASKAGRTRVQTVKHEVCRPLSAFICFAPMTSLVASSVLAAAAASALEVWSAIRLMNSSRCSATLMTREQQLPFFLWMSLPARRVQMSVTRAAS